MDITANEKTYAHYLQKDMSKISQLFEDKSIDVNQFRQSILEIIAAATETKAKQKFKATLNQHTNKTSMMFYVGNAWLKGAGLGLH